MKIKVSEVFFSLQGEGLYLGTPSIFLRTFGCNFQCGGYAMPQGKKSEEHLAIDPSKYTKYEDLPLVHTGCDSYASWSPRFKHMSPTLTIDEIVERIVNLLPDRRFGTNKHLIITGGEPLLGWQRSYPSLLAELYEHGLAHITFETNGTQKLNDDLFTFLKTSKLNVTFSISSKLPSSGEPWGKAIRPDAVVDYCLFDAAYFKWVITNPRDIDDALRAFDEYYNFGINIPVYLMPAGGTAEIYNENKHWVAELAKQHGFRFSPRLQIDLYGNAWGT